MLVLVLTCRCNDAVYVGDSIQVRIVTIGDRFVTLRLDNAGQISCMKLKFGDDLDIGLAQINIRKKGRAVKFGFVAPSEVRILREELFFKEKLKEARR